MKLSIIVAQPLGLLQSIQFSLAQLCSARHIANADTSRLMKSLKTSEQVQKCFAKTSIHETIGDWIAATRRIC